jgi:hypothetical protein
MIKDFDTLYSRLPEALRHELSECIQNPIYHPEGSVENHIKIVFDNVCKLYDGDQDLLVTALFHDLGKPASSVVKERDGVMVKSHIGHELLSLDFISQHIDKFTDLPINIEKVKTLVKNHMRAHLYLNNTMTKKSKRLQFEQNQYFEDLIKFAKCDGKPQ